MADIMRRFEHLQAAEWLSLAAAPIFALMAILAGTSDNGAHLMQCTAAMDMSPLTGMLSMYALMSAFHLTPWLKLISRWRRGVGGARSESPCAVRNLGARKTPMPCATEGARRRFRVGF